MTTRDYGDIQAELASKALDTLTAWANRNQAGRISDRELFIAADAIHDTISGLVPLEVLDTVYAVRQDIRANAKRKPA